MKHNQNGSANFLGLLIVSVVLLVFSLAFTAWAFSSRQVYKNKSDVLVSNAVAIAKQQQQTKDNASFAIAEENPLSTYTGPQAYGSLIIKYPRTWSSFVDTTNASGTPIDGYFYPGTLPSVDGGGTTNFPLRVQLQQQTYSQALSQYAGAQVNGTVTVAPFALAKLPNIVGVEITGKLSNGKSGTLILLPLRSQALEVWTESNQYLTDFNTNILPNLSFSP